MFCPPPLTYFDNTFLFLSYRPTRVHSRVHCPPVVIVRNYNIQLNRVNTFKIKRPIWCSHKWTNRKKKSYLSFSSGHNERLQLHILRGNNTDINTIIHSHVSSEVSMPHLSNWKCRCSVHPIGWNVTDMASSLSIWLTSAGNINWFCAIQKLVTVCQILFLLQEPNHSPLLWHSGGLMLDILL